MAQCKSDRLQLKKPLRVFPKQHKPHAFQVDTSKGFWVWGFSIHDDEGLAGKHQTSDYEQRNPPIYGNLLASGCSAFYSLQDKRGNWLRSPFLNHVWFMTT